MLRGASGRAAADQGAEPDLLDTIFKDFAPDAPAWMPGPRQPEDYYKRAQQLVEWCRKREFTSGAYETEAESAAAFDRAVPWDLFKVHHEVSGVLISPRPAQIERARTKGQDEIKMRIDRVLVPKPKLLDEYGWRFGIIGCELKRSGEKIGPVLGQAMDYSRAVWLLDPGRQRFRICLDYVFIWPMEKQGGTIASICAQNRIGSAYGDTRYVQFGLKAGETSILDVQRNGQIRVGKPSSGSRAGSR